MENIMSDDKQKKAMLAVKKSHMALMKHKSTYLYTGIIMLGESEVTDEVETLWTDGINKAYNPDYFLSLSVKKQRGAVLHVNLHVATKQFPRHGDLLKKDQKLFDISSDMVVNNLINDIKQEYPDFIEIPDGLPFHPMFKNWTTREVFWFLSSGRNPDGSSDGTPKIERDKDGNITGIRVGGNQFNFDPDKQDEHDAEDSAKLTPEERKEAEEHIDVALQQGGLLAGMSGNAYPRALGDALIVNPDWREVMQEFYVDSMRGADEYTFKSYNRKRLADDLYRPTTICERVGRLILAIDTSASISGESIRKVAGQLVSLCELTMPDEIRVLWWDTRVCAEQIFESNYENLREVLKPAGGGGTHVSCVSNYIRDQNLSSDCVVVFTDGYVERDIDWQIPAPTLWVVDGNDSFAPPTGKVVKFTND
jgi:predicted metal-dependent peptidase